MVSRPVLWPGCLFLILQSNVYVILECFAPDVMESDQSIFRYLFEIFRPTPLGNRGPDSSIFAPFPLKLSDGCVSDMLGVGFGPRGWQKFGPCNLHDFLYCLKQAGGVIAWNVAREQFSSISAHSTCIVCLDIKNHQRHGNGKTYKTTCTLYKNGTLKHMSTAHMKMCGVDQSHSKSIDSAHSRNCTPKDRDVGAD